MAEVHLKVVGLPDKKLAYDNAVYVNPGMQELLSDNVNYLQINGGIVYVLRSHPGVEAGEIGMNTKQRSCTDANDGQAIRCRRWVAGPNLQALSVRFEINLASEKKRETIKEDDVAKFVKNVYKDHAMTKGQIFIAGLGGKVCTLKVLSVQVASTAEEKANRGSLTQYGSVGLISSHTEIEVDPAENRRLTFEKSETKQASPLFKPDWQFSDMGIGGLDTEFSSIFRRSFASRMFPPDVIAKLGIKHVKGMLLFGPPGTGKTLIARQIGKMLAGTEPKIVNGPEILNKYVGASEENIRKLFEDAEKEYAEKGEASELHIIIFDEIDAICKQRGSNRGGTGVHDTIVNQLLTKIDGVDSPNNLLVIGMTNRKDMIDSALLRPGRLEVHVEIGLPDEEGRLQIFKIHTRKMQEGGFMAPDVDLMKLAEESKNFSGAEIEGVVKSASSYALYGSIDVTQGDSGPAVGDRKILVCMEDFMAALGEVTPSLGVAEDELKMLLRGSIIDWGAPYRGLLETGNTLRMQVGDPDSKTPLLSCLFEGTANSGKTSIIAKLAMESQFPFIRIISAESLLGYDERSKCDRIQKAFEDAYKSPQSLILLDDIERLLDYVPIGPRFSNQILQTLHVLIKRVPPKENCRLLVLATTNNAAILEDMDLKQAFNVILKVPQLSQVDEVKKVLDESALGLSASDADDIAVRCPLPIPIKQLLMVLEMTKQRAKTAGVSINGACFTQCVRDAGLSPPLGDF